MSVEKIGHVRFYASTYSPEPGEADVHFSHGDENMVQLVIELDTKDPAKAIERGRRIVQLWQLSEDMVADGQLAAIFRNAELCNAWTEVKMAIGEEILKILQAIASGVERWLGRGRGPGPSLQAGPVSHAPTHDDMQGKRQE